MALETVTDATFEDLVLKSEKPVLLFFWAKWNSPSETVLPYIEEIQKEYEGKLFVGRVDVDKSIQVINATYKIRVIPTVFLLKNGQVMDKTIGPIPKSAYIRKIEDAFFKY
jgi:thioredoxin 1